MGSNLNELKFYVNSLLSYDEIVLDKVFANSNSLPITLVTSLSRNETKYSVVSFENSILEPVSAAMFFKGTEVVEGESWDVYRTSVGPKALSNIKAAQATNTAVYVNFTNQTTSYGQGNTTYTYRGIYNVIPTDSDELLAFNVNDYIGFNVDNVRENADTWLFNGTLFIDQSKSIGDFETDNGITLGIHGDNTEQVAVPVSKSVTQNQELSDFSDIDFINEEINANSVSIYNLETQLGAVGDENFINSNFEDAGYSSDKFSEFDELAFKQVRNLSELDDVKTVNVDGLVESILKIGSGTYPTYQDALDVYPIGTNPLNVNKIVTIEDNSVNVDNGINQWSGIDNSIWEWREYRRDRTQAYQLVDTGNLGGVSGGGGGSTTSTSTSNPTDESIGGASTTQALINIENKSAIVNLQSGVPAVETQHHVNEYKVFTPGDDGDSAYTIVSAEFTPGDTITSLHYNGGVLIEGIDFTVSSDVITFITLTFEDTDTLGLTFVYGSAAANIVEFSDNEFAIFNSANNSKKIAFDASGVGIGLTRTITMPNSDVDLSNYNIKTYSTLADIGIDGVNLSDTDFGLNASTIFTAMGPYAILQLQIFASNANNLRLSIESEIGIFSGVGVFTSYNDLTQTNKVEVTLNNENTTYVGSYDNSWLGFDKLITTSPSGETAVTGELSISAQGDNVTLLDLITDRGWSFRQLDTGSISKLALVTGDDDKDFVIMSNSEVIGDRNKYIKFKPGDDVSVSNSVIDIDGVDFIGSSEINLGGFKMSRRSGDKRNSSTPSIYTTNGSGSDFPDAGHLIFESRSDVARDIKMFIAGIEMVTINSSGLSVAGDRVPTHTYSTSAPTGGVDGDIHFRY